MSQALKEPYVLLEETGSGYIAQPSGHEVFYDEAAGLLHIVEGRMVSAVPLPGAENSAANTAASFLSSTPSLLPPLSTPRSHQGASLLSTPEKPGPEATEENEQQQRLSIPSLAPSPSLPHHHRTVSDAVSTTSTATTTTPSRAFLVSSGPPITAVCASLDGAFTALQRSKLQVEFFDHSNGNMFVEVPQNRGAGLHGFFWTDALDAEFIMVTSMGLELYSPKIGSQGLKHTAFQRLSAVQWFLWSHSTRVLVCGCGTSGAKLQSFQFSRHSGVVRLPMLDLTPPWGSPMKSQSRGQSQSHAMRAAPWLLVSPTQVWVLLLYRRVFIAYHDVTSTLKLYRLYRDATAVFAELPLTGKGGAVYVGGSKDIELSVVEDVLIVHCIQGYNNEDHSTVKPLDMSSGSGGASSGGASSGGGGDVNNRKNETGTALLFDIAKESVVGPSGIRVIEPVVSTPTQLGVVLLHEDNEEEDGEDEENMDQHRVREGASSEIISNSNKIEQQQQHRLSLFYPDIGLDQASNRLFRLQIDLLALSEACFNEGEIPSLLSFLQQRQEWRKSRHSRRSDSVMLDPRRDPRHVRLRILRRMVNERAAPAVLRAAFDAVLAPSRQQQKKGEEKKEEDYEDDDDEYRSMHAKEIALGILAPALQISSSPRTTKSPPSSPPAPVYVVAALSELLSSCYTTGNYPLHADIASLYITAYSYAGKDHLLSSLLRTHARLLDSVELAERLAAGEVLLRIVPHHQKYNISKSGISSIDTTKNEPSTFLLIHLAVEMLNRLGKHKEVCNLLLRQGDIPAAVKHAENRLDREDAEDIYTAAYNKIIANSSGKSNLEIKSNEEKDRDIKALKFALERYLEDARTRKASSLPTHTQHSSPQQQNQQAQQQQRRQSLSSVLTDAFSTAPEFLDQQTVSLVEALENF